MTDLARLAEPFPRNLIHQNPSGAGRGDYVSHSAVTEKLLAVVGPYCYEIVRELHGTVKGKDQLGTVVVGCVARLTVTIDGNTVAVTEVGDCEQPGNWPHDGARLKDASSDAIKRCAMRLGVGLHLWSQTEFFLDRVLSGDGTMSGPSPATPPPLSAGEGPSPTENRAALTQAVKDRHLTEAKKQQFRAELISRGLPQSVKDMDEDQARDALAVLNEKFPEELTLDD